VSGSSEGEGFELKILKSDKLNISVQGFTLVEILLVLVLISLLAGLSAPIVTKSIQRSKESALQENLLVMRTALDAYYADKGVYPAALQALVDDKYIRFIPVDPITQNKDSWQIVFDDESDDPGVSDVRSGSDQLSMKGSRFSEW